MNFEKTYFEALQDQLMKDIHAKVESVIKERLFEITGEEIDPVKESQRVFPRIARIIDNDGSHNWYWRKIEDNEERVITIVKFSKPIFNNDGNKITVNMNFLR